MRFQGLGRKENPTERAIVEVVHPDGTYDCRVPGRPHPYTRLQTCGGQRPLHVGQTVEVAFVDYQRTGRRWMPFILGASQHHVESGMTRGRVSRGLAWHNGQDGTPDYTGSLYSLDTGYRKWRPDAGWSIPGPWDAIIGYTVDQGYILTIRGRDVRCYLAESGTPVWDYELPDGIAKPVYNPARREVVFLDTTFSGARNDAILEAILEATTGRVLAAGQTLPRGTNRLYRVFLWGDRLYDIRRFDWDSNQEDLSSRIWVRDGANGYVLTGSVAWVIPDLPWGLTDEYQTYYFNFFPCACNGKAAVRVGGARPPSVGGRAWTSMGLLDMSTATHTVTDVIYGPEPSPEGAALLSVHATVEAMSPDGYLHGVVLTGESYLVLTHSRAIWSPDGTRLHTGPVEDGWTPSTFFLSRLSGSGLAAVQDRATGIQSITQNLSILWSLPSGDTFTGYGGESTRGEDPWVLVGSPGGWHFRDFKTGAVLGPWAGSRPVMVSAGIIYDTDDEGNLRRWTE